MFFIYLAPIYDLPYTKTSASFANRFVDLRAPPSLTSRCICYYYIKYYIEADFQVRRPSRSLDIYVTTYHNFRKEKICTSFIGYAYICRLR